MESSICKERARGAQEFARVGAWVFDVTKAKQIAAMNKIRQISVKEVRSTALPPPPREGYTSLSGFAVDEEHLSHIPDPTEPVIIGTFPTPPRIKRTIHISFLMVIIVWSVQHTKAAAFQHTF
jgi:hypothetical protein